MGSIEFFGVPVSEGDPKDKLRDLFRGVRVVIMDVDGVLTDGKISFSESGEEIRSFSARDRVAIKEAVARGLKFAVISDRESKATMRWLTEIGVTDVYMGVANKLDAYDEIKLRCGVQDEECAYIGDDIDDIPVFERVGLSITPISGIEYLRHRVQYVSGYEGGNGCVREIIEMVLSLQDKWEYFDQPE